VKSVPVEERGAYLFKKNELGIEFLAQVQNVQEVASKYTGLIFQAAWEELTISLFKDNLFTHHLFE
jgi:hypothetical protein